MRRLRVSYFLTSIAESKFVLIEFYPELMNVNVDELMETLMLLEKGRLWIINQWKNGHWKGGSSRQTSWSNKGQWKFDYRIKKLTLCNNMSCYMYIIWKQSWWYYWQRSCSNFNHNINVQLSCSNAIHGVHVEVSEFFLKYSLFLFKCIVFMLKFQ